MERGLSPLVSIARATEVCAAERDGDRHEEPADENCNWFREEIMVASQCCTGHEVVPPSFGVGLDLTAEAILIFLSHLARNGRVLNRQCAAYFTG